MAQDLNQVVLVGTLKGKPILHESEYGIPYATMILSIKKDLEKFDGSFIQEEYEIKLWNTMAIKVVEVAEIDDVVAIKGCLNKSAEGQLEIVASKVFMLNGE